MAKKKKKTMNQTTRFELGTDKAGSFFLLFMTIDEYHCPITLRTFNENTHIVAIKTSGNVFAYDAVERLNIKAKFWKDLMTDEPFTRKDIITIQVLHISDGGSSLRL